MMPVIANENSNSKNTQKWTFLAKHNIKSSLSFPEAVKKAEEIMLKNLEHYHQANYFKIT